MDKIRITTCTVLGTTGSLIVSRLGGWSSDLMTLFLFMFIDFVMGLMIAFVFKKSSKTASGKIESNAVFKSICKKTVSLFFVLIGYRMDITFEMNYVRVGIVIAFIVHELVSIIEKAGIMGLSLPKVITDAVGILQNNVDKE